MHVPRLCPVAFMSAFCLCRSRWQSTKSGEAIQRGEYTIQDSPVKNSCVEVHISRVGQF